MTPIFPIRQARTALFALFAVATLASSCKKNGGADDVDPRDQYVGTYSGTSRRTVYVIADAFIGPIPGTATTTITKGSNAKEIYIATTVVYNGGFSGGYTLQTTAELDGNNFTVIDKKSDQIELPNGKVDSDYTATGTFDSGSKQFAYTATAQALRNGAQYKRTDEVVGTRQ